MLISKTLNKILVPLDGSKNSLRGLKFASIIAKQSGSSIVGLNVCSIPIFLKTPPMVAHEIRQQSKDIIKEASALLQKDIQFAGFVKTSKNVGKTIVTFAKEHKIDMIIMGSKGPDPEVGVFLGSVANYVVNKSKIPVTVIK